MKVSVAIATPAIPLHGGGAGNGAAILITSDANGFAIDFLSNTYALNTNSGAESLIYTDQLGFALDLLDNSYSVRT